MINKHQNVYLNQRGVAQAALKLNCIGQYYDGTPGFIIPITDKGGSPERFRVTGWHWERLKHRHYGQAGKFFYDIILGNGREEPRPYIYCVNVCRDGILAVCERLFTKIKKPSTLRDDPYFL